MYSVSVLFFLNDLRYPRPSLQLCCYRPGLLGNLPWCTGLTLLSLLSPFFPVASSWGMRMRDCTEMKVQRIPVTFLSSGVFMTRHKLWIWTLNELDEVIYLEYIWNDFWAPIQSQTQWSVPVRYLSRNKIFVHVQMQTVIWPFFKLFFFLMDFILWSSDFFLLHGHLFMSVQNVFHNMDNGFGQHLYKVLP